jgi:hypothetical protein
MRCFMRKYMFFNYSTWGKKCQQPSLLRLIDQISVGGF